MHCSGTKEHDKRLLHTTNECRAWLGQGDDGGAKM